MTGKPCVVVREMSKRPAAAVVLAELMEDAAARITPLTDVDAREMVRSLRTFGCLWATAARRSATSRPSTMFCCD
jgi:carbamoylphosphate synthase small subunit